MTRWFKFQNLFCGHLPRQGCLAAGGTREGHSAAIGRWKPRLVGGPELNSTLASVSCVYSLCPCRWPGGRQCESSDSQGLWQLVGKNPGQGRQRRGEACQLQISLASHHHIFRRARPGRERRTLWLSCDIWTHREARHMASCSRSRPFSSRAVALCPSAS